MITNNKILIVDDNLKNLQVTAKILKDEGFLISLAQNGQSALEQLNVHIPDLILLDIMMPDMDGIEVCNHIKADDRLKEIPVIFLTAKTQTEDLVKGFNAGAVDYITKPFNREELLMRVKNHLELAAAKKTIIEMNRNRDKLYSMIAHDIRSPFASITQIIEAISNGYIELDSDLFKEFFTLLKQKTSETNILLNNLLDWTRFQSDKITFSYQQLNLKEILSECVQLLDGNARNKDIKIELSIPEDMEAYCDEVTIHTVFRNIISNAIKFTPDKGNIAITASKADQWVTVSIKDNGIGMSEEIINKIFDKNEHHTTFGTKNEKGTGLGLYLVKDFVFQNHGELEVHSKLNEGTTIVVKLLPCFDCGRVRKAGKSKK